MMLEEIWKSCLDGISEIVSKHVFDTWFRPIGLGPYIDRVLTLTVPNKFFGDRLRENYGSMILDEVSRQIPDDGIQISFVVSEPRTNLNSAPAAPPEPDRADRRSLRRTLNLMNRYTFETFVVGASNQFAHAASRRVAERPGAVYNPLFIYGGVGLGKTHLLNAVGNYICTGFPEMRIDYISSEQFTNEVINSIRYDRMADFRRRYRTVDVLLIDDIQFIAGKERTQEEFFHTFNTLYETNKQIVISSDRSTKEMSDMEERLRSRFEMGLIADIQPPDLETKTAILKRKAESEGIGLDDEVALFIGSRIKTNIRELEGSLIRLGAFASLTGEHITVDLARKVLGNILDERQKVITVDEIQKVVSDRFRIKIAELKAKKRTKTLVFPRQIAMYLCRELTELSFPEIGKYFGGKDHSTVIHAVRHISRQIETDSQSKQLLEDLIKKLKSR